MNLTRIEACARGYPFHLGEMNRMQAQLADTILTNLGVDHIRLVKDELAFRSEANLLYAVEFLQDHSPKDFGPLWGSS